MSYANSISIKTNMKRLRERLKHNMHEEEEEQPAEVHLIPNEDTSVHEVRRQIRHSGIVPK